MCTQTFNVYHCHCRQKGEFEQCDRLYNLGVNLQCVKVETKEKKFRSYCATHLLKEGTPTVVYDIGTGREVKWPREEGDVEKGEAEE